MNTQKKAKLLLLIFPLFALLIMGDSQRSFAVTSEGAVEFTKRGELPNTNQVTPPKADVPAPNKQLPSTGEKIVKSISILGVVLAVLAILFLWRRKKRKGVAGDEK
ncbi:LPXTG-motif cell wall anchor domain-containing protein [Pilibacter termitis]|uniref:LPXTG-motif cell wall anchor domain-containing protein n=1 Tax=Pilibacter termitis TaxID=263852 RepID=A0A1T4Q6W5_9ENTE|nr:LPXTG cell wall anchor domain-containing protein [Pilibacter termitis]SJZ99500.1 LPXTG-motif cell wall anchor domain-containing protein [Pilibacter termitis]